MILINKNLNKKFIIFKKKKYFFKKKSCEICGSKNSKIFQNLGKIGNKPGTYGYLPISICLNCGHKFLSPRFSDKYYKKFYEEEYGKIPFKKIKPSHKYLKLQKERGNNVYSFFSKKIKKIKNGNILDHGAATGLALIPWKKNGWNCYGVEPHKASVNYAKQMGLKVELGYGENLSFASDFFDVIISLGSFEHAYDINKTFSEFSRVVKNNGKLILRWRSDKFKGSPLEYYNHITYRYFSKNSLFNLLNKYNFKIEHNINKKIEGYDTYEYIIARKVKKFKKKLLRPKISFILNYHKNYYKKYLEICKKIKKLKKPNNLTQKKLFIKKNKLGTMNIGITRSIIRVFFEMKSYFKFIKEHKLEE